MGYGWNLRADRTLPAVMGIEQEIPIYRVANSQGFRLQAGYQNGGLIQLTGSDLTKFTRDFIKSKFKVAANFSDCDSFVDNGRIYVD